METKIINNRLVKIWASSVDAKAMQQIENLTTLPFLFHHLAIMPDVHAGWVCPLAVCWLVKMQLYPMPWA